MQISIRLFCLSVVAILCLAAVALAQEAASSGVVGIVTDPAGAAVPGVAVKITDLGTRVERESATDPGGGYTFPNLRPGRYEVRVEATGFQAAVTEPFDIQIGQVVRRNIALRVGAVSESVVVLAEAPLMQSENATVGQTIDEKKIAELPLNGRNLVQLAALSAGVSPRRFGFTQYGERNLYVTVEGGRDASTNYVIDGVYVRSLRFNNLSLQPALDTIQEFGVLRNSFSAQYGQGQSVVTAVTKSGTNDFHGTAFEFLRNDKLDARNFFAAQKPAYRRNQFGFTAVGRS